MMKHCTTLELGKMTTKGNGFEAKGFQGRVALVTGAGAADGIGFAAAKLLAEAGAKVAITSTTKRINDRLKELPGAAASKAAHIADLSDNAQAKAVVAAVKKQFGRLDILVNNAGKIQTGKKNTASRVESIDDDEWRRALARNLDTCFFVTRAAVPIMQRQKYGRIVTVCSVSGPLVTFPKGGAYGTAKAAMMGYTRSLALELAAQNITANAIAPGWIATGSQ